LDWTVAADPKLVKLRELAEALLRSYWSLRPSLGAHAEGLQRELFGLILAADVALQNLAETTPRLREAEALVKRVSAGAEYSIDMVAELEAPAALRQLELWRGRREAALKEQTASCLALESTALRIRSLDHELSESHELAKQTPRTIESIHWRLQAMEEAATGEESAATELGDQRSSWSIEGPNEL